MQARIGRRELFQWLILSAGATFAHSAGKPRPILYVTNSLGDDIMLIDLETLKLAGSIKVGEHPHGLAGEASGRRLFTTIESEHTLKVIDTATNKIKETLPLRGRPNQCAATPDGRFVAVPIRDGNAVEIFDMNQRRAVKVLPVQVPHNCFNAGSNLHLWVTSMGADEVNLIDVERLEYVAKVPVGGVPRPLAVTRDERTLYSALSDLHGFVIVDIPSRKLLRKVVLPPAPPNTDPLEPHAPTHGLALTPDERELWVTSLGDGGMYVFDTRSGTVSKLIPVGIGPNWVTFSADGRYCAVSNTTSGDCSVIDTKARHEVARIKVGRAPKRLLAVNVPAATA
jgi:YVTN family beta-propeller protein